MKAYLDSERCKGCGLCIENCPRSAIGLTLNMNTGGYNYVAVDTEKCIGCGICYTVCPDGAFSILNEKGRV